MAGESWITVSVQEHGVGKPGFKVETHKLEVEGGWLYRTAQSYWAQTDEKGPMTVQALAVALTFVPK